MQKICTKFHCKKCDYICSRKFLWNQHIKTIKHNGNIWKHLETKNMHICSCGKPYKTRSGLFKHKKKSKVSLVRIAAHYYEIFKIIKVIKQLKKLGNLNV